MERRKLVYLLNYDDNGSIIIIALATSECLLYIKQDGKLFIHQQI